MTERERLHAALTDRITSMPYQVSGTGEEAYCQAPAAPERDFSTCSALL